MSRLPWTDDQRATLRRTWLDPSLSLRAVSHAVGYSHGACTKEAARLGLPVRATIRATDAYRFRPIEREQPTPARPLRPGERTIPLLPSER